MAGRHLVILPWSLVLRWKQKLFLVKRQMCTVTDEGTMLWVKAVTLNLIDPVQRQAMIDSATDVEVGYEVQGQDQVTYRVTKVVLEEEAVDEPDATGQHQRIPGKLAFSHLTLEIMDKDSFAVAQEDRAMHRRAVRRGLRLQSKHEQMLDAIQEHPWKDDHTEEGESHD